MDASAVHQLCKEADRASEDTRACPSGWTQAQFCQMVTLRNEKVFPESEGNLPFVGMDDIDTDGLTIARSRPFVGMRSVASRCRPGDLLYGRLRPYLNKTAVVETEAACSGELLVFVSTGACEARYLQYFMHSRGFVRWASAATSGDRPRVSFDAISAFPVPLPPLAEQRRIVARIDALFAEIAEGEAALQEARRGLEVFRRALLKGAVTGELTKDWRGANVCAETGEDLLARITSSAQPVKTRPHRGKTGGSDHDSQTLLDLPDNWTWAKLSDLGFVGRGRSRHRPRDDARLYGGFMPFLQTGIIARSGSYIKHWQQTYSPFGVDQSRVWPSGTLCITIAANIADTAITTFDCCFPDSVVGFKSSCEIDPFWVHLWLQTIQRKLERFAPATAQKNINLEVLDRIRVPLPPPAEAQEIIRRVRAGFDAISDFETAADVDIAGLKQSILKAAFEGRLVPQDPNDEPASALLERLHAEPKPTRTNRRRASA